MESASIELTLKVVSWELMDLCFGDITEDGWFWYNIDRKSWPIEAINDCDRFTYMLDAQQ